jgi:hypothetical protein
MNPRGIDVGTVRSFPRPAQLKTYGLNLSPAFSNKIARVAEAQGVSPEDFIVACVRTCVPGDEATWHAEEKNG